MNELIQKVLDVALGEVGYIEKETYDQLDDADANPGDENYTKYQRDLAKMNYFNSSKKGVAWCAVFACWVPVQVVGEAMAKKLLCQPDKGNAGAGCNAQMNYYKDKGRFFTSDPQVGDQVIFWNADKTEANHIGWIYKVDKTRIYTVEGNTTGKIPFVTHGGIVGKQKYKLTYDRIAGYGRPRWELAEGWVDTTKEETKQDTTQDVIDEAIEIPGMVTGDAWVRVTSGTTVNYRTRPNITAKRVAACPRIKHGEKVYIKTSDGTWAAVEYRGHRGYVMMKYLTQVNPNGGDVAEEPVVNEAPSEEPSEEIVKPEPRTYTTVQGDTLWAISCRMLGSGRRYKEIMRLNGMRNTIVRPGMVLKIPE